MSDRTSVFTRTAVVVLALGLAGTFPVRKNVMAAADKENPIPRAHDGKKLLTSLDSLKIKSVAAPALSPGGNRVAYTVAETTMDKDKEWKTVTQVWVVSSDGKDARQFTRGEKNATNPDWSPDGRYLAFLTNREKEAERQVWFIAADGGEAWQITTHKGGVSGFRFSPDGKKLALTAVDQPAKEEEEAKKLKDDTILVDRDHKMTHLWLWDIEAKEGKRLTQGDYTCSDPQWSPDGTRLSFTANPTPKADDGSLTDIWILTVASGERKKLIENPGSDQAARWSPDGQWIAYTGTPRADGVVQPDLHVIPAQGGTPRILTSAFDLDAGSPNWSPDSKVILFGTTTRQAAEVFSCDVASGAIKQVTQNNSVISIADVSTDGRTIVGTFNNPGQPTEIYRSDMTFRSVERITDHNGWLKEYALGDAEVVRWKSKDGAEIEGVLTKPVGFNASRKYPFLVNPHGGPTGASLTSFNATAQLLAANGYLILQPNFRGSIGRGEKFAMANKNTWGLGDYEDCMTGLQFVVDRGWADPERLGAFGWSYGGYMTFWMLTQTDRFKAVSPGAGLTNIYSMYSQNDIQRYLRWFYDDKSPWDNFELYWDRSPMKHVKRVKTPTLIMHGQNDVRVPIAQAQEFHRALVEMGVPVEFVVYPREGHGILEPRHQLDRLRRYLTFFGKYLNNPPATEPAAEKKPATSTQ